MNKNTNSAFSAKLLPLLSAKENSVISPFGIAAVLSMAAEGASEESLNEILSASGFNSLDELRASVLAEIKRPNEAFKNENSVVLASGKEDIKLLDEYKKAISEQYSASVYETCGGNNPFVMLKNICSFRAEWLLKMERDISHDMSFKNYDNSICYPAFLSCTEKMHYYISKNCGKSIKAVSLPYKHNRKAIPYELILADSNNPLYADELDEIFKRMKKGKCEVSFPEFSVNSTYDLIPMMKALGLKSIFDENNSAFDRIATKPLYANEFKQKAEILVDKNGTVAKAKTFMVCCLGKCIDSEKTILIFDKPFSYFIRNTKTGEILFMGKVNRLTDCEKEPHELPDPSVIEKFFEARHK